MEPATVTAPAAAIPIEEVRAQFPILELEVNGKPLCYLDNGATAQKPLAVIEALDEFNRRQNANVHRGVYELSERATELYEQARRRVAAHLGAQPREVVFVRNATEAINLVAYSWGRANVGAGDRILLTEMEHHSNVVPWQILAQEVGAQIDYVPLTDEGRLDMGALRALLEWEPKLVAVAHVANVLGTIAPVAEIAHLAHEAGATVLVDGAQAAPKLPLDMAEVGADFYAITSHKMYGPTGVGALWGRAELLDEMPPFMGGGSMIGKVGREGATWAAVPAKFEAGTPAIAQAIGFGVAAEWLDGLGMENVHPHEADLAAYALDRLAEVPGLRVFGPPAGEDRAAIVSFTLEGIHPHDVAQILDRHAVCVRAGHHCAQILMDCLGIPAATRASFAVYNTREDADRLIDALHDARRVFKLD